MELEELRKRLPHLAEELEKGKTQSIQIDAVRYSSGYEPTVIDYLRKCSNEQQALEIINWYFSQEKIAYDQVVKLKNQLKEKGVNSFR